MYNLVCVKGNGIAVHLTRLTVKGFKKWCISNAMDETWWWCGMSVKMIWKLKGEYGEGTDLKMETVTLTGEGK